MSKALILLIEDEKVLQNVYKLILSAAGYKVHTANNGAEGLAALKKLKPAVILLDIFMPVLDGKEFLRNFNQSDFPTTRVVVFSNLSDPETQNEVFQLGAHEFVLKSNMAPQDLVDLVARLTKQNKRKV